MALSAANRSRLHATLACVIAGGLWWRTRAVAFATIGTIALVLFALAWINPRLYEPVQRLFTAFGRVLTAVFTWVVLGLVYFFVFTPLRVWNRIFGRDPLGLRAASNTGFLHEFRPKTLGQFERQY